MKNLQSYFDFKITSVSLLRGSTQQEIYLVNNQYVIKFIDIQELKLIKEFLINANRPFVKVLVFGKNYLIYQFVEQSDSLKITKFWFDKLLDVILNYPVLSYDDKDVYAYVLAETTENIQQVKSLFDFESLKVIDMMINSLADTKSESCLLHGDLGIHNFIFQDNQLVCIIDPEPYYGPRILDILAAVVSSPLLLDKTDLEVIRQAFGLSKEQFDVWLLISLLERIVRSKFHHPQDVMYYREKILEIIKKGE